MRIKISYPAGIIFILGAACSAFFALTILLHQGVPLNKDLSLWYNVFVCAKESGTLNLPAVWCPQTNMGLAPFQFYGPFPFHVMALLGMVISSAAAYKMVLIAIWLSVPLAVWFFLRRAGHPIAGAFAFLLGVLGPGIGANQHFNRIFLFGAFSNSLASALFFVFLAFAVSFFKEPTRKRLIPVVLILAAYLLAHITTFILIIPATLIFLVWSFRDRLRRSIWLLCAIPVLVFFLVAYYFLPLTTNLSQYSISEFESGSLILSSFSMEFLSSIEMSLLLLAGICGLALMWKKHPKDYGLVLPLFGTFCGLWGIVSVLYLMGIRITLPFDRLLLTFRDGFILGSAFLIEVVFREVSVRLGKAAGCVFLLVVVSGAAMALIPPQVQSSSQIVYSFDEDLEKAFDVGRFLDTVQGRVFVEDTHGQLPEVPEFRRFGGLHLWAASSLFTKTELVGAGDRWSIKDDFSDSLNSKFLGTPIDNLSAKSLAGQFKMMGVGHVVLTSSIYQKALEYGALVYPLDPFYVLKVSNPSYFLHSRGSSALALLGGEGFVDIRSYPLVKQDYSKTSGAAVVDGAEDGVLIFKVRYWPNWVAYVDGRQVSVLETTSGLVAIEIPKGRHSVEFEFKPRLANIIGSFLTLVGLAGVLALCLYGSHRL